MCALSLADSVRVRSFVRVVVVVVSCLMFHFEFEVYFVRTTVVSVLIASRNIVFTSSFVYGSGARFHFWLSAKSGTEDLLLTIVVGASCVLSVVVVGSQESSLRPPKAESKLSGAHHL